MIGIVIAGVGGQGTLLASKILGTLAIEHGYDVRVSEVHGMSQRGGVVRGRSLCEHSRACRTRDKCQEPALQRLPSRVRAHGSVGDQMACHGSIDDGPDQQQGQLQQGRQEVADRILLRRLTHEEDAAIKEIRAARHGAGKVEYPRTPGDGQQRQEHQRNRVSEDHTGGDPVTDLVLRSAADAPELVCIGKNCWR